MFQQTCWTCRVKPEKTHDAHTAFVTLSAQLAVIISDISPMFPPGEPETTNNKGKTFLTNSARSIDAGAAVPFTGRLVLVCLVFCRSVSLLTQKKFRSLDKICLENKQHSQRANKVSQPSDVALRAQCVFTSMGLYLSSRHILLSPCESRCPLSDAYKCDIWQWDDTRSRRWRTCSPNRPLPCVTLLRTRHPSLLFLWAGSTVDFGLRVSRPAL